MNDCFSHGEKIRAQQLLAWQYHYFLNKAKPFQVVVRNCSTLYWSMWHSWENLSGSVQIQILTIQSCPLPPYCMQPWPGVGVGAFSQAAEGKSMFYLFSEGLIAYGGIWKFACHFGGICPNWEKGQGSFNKGVGWDLALASATKIHILLGPWNDLALPEHPWKAFWALWCNLLHVYSKELDQQSIIKILEFSDPANDNHSRTQCMSELLQNRGHNFCFACRRSQVQSLTFPLKAGKL